MHARTLAAAATALLALPAAPALADEVGDVSASGAHAAVALRTADGGARVAVLDRNGAVTRSLAPAGAATSLPDVAAAGERFVAAWRAGRVVSPALVPPQPEGVFSGRFDAVASPVDSPIVGAQRSGSVPERVHVAGRPDGSHVLVWVEPGAGLRTQAISAAGEAGEAQALDPEILGVPLVTTSRRHVWVVYAKATGVLHVVRLSRGARVADEYVLAPEGGGDFTPLDVAPDHVGGVVVTSFQQSRSARTLLMTHATTGLAYTAELARAGRAHDFAAQAGYANGRAIVAYDDARGASRALVGPTRRDRLGRGSRAIRLGTREHVEDLATDERGRVRLLVNGRRGMALRALSVRRGRISGGRALVLSASSRGQSDGRLALGSGGRAFAAWEQQARPDCTQVVASSARGRVVSPVELTAC